MSDLQASRWRLLLQQPDLVEQMAILPTEFVRALGYFVEKAIRLAEETYAISYGQDVDTELGKKVQSSGTGASGRRVLNGRFASHLSHEKHGLPSWLYREGDIMAEMTRQGVDHRHEPRFNRKKPGV